MKKLLFALVPLLIGGGVVGAALLGLIHIPGLTPTKPKTNLYAADAQYTEPAGPGPVEPQPQAKDKAKPPPPPPAEPKRDLAAAAKKVARVWNDVPPAELSAICKGWKDEDLARVLLAMDPEKSAALIAEIARSDPNRATKLTQEMLQVAAIQTDTPQM
jgi:hypothetical protein